MEEPVASAGDEPRYLRVGIVRKPHGIRGELSVYLETDHPDAVFAPGRSLWIGDAADRPTEERLTVERARPFKDGVLLKAVEHSTRDEAVEKLRGAVLLIPEAEAAPLKEDEIFYHRLIGMRVVGPEGEVGKVERVWELAAGDLLEVRRPDGSELLVPFVQAVVRKVDPEADTLEIDPPPGLLEL